MSEDYNDKPKTHRNLAKQTHELMSRMAMTDPLTGLNNKRGFEKYMNLVKDTLRRKNELEDFTLVVLDLVGLKRLNEALTNPVVNELLKETGKVFQETAKRSTDIWGRTGGDEFMFGTVNQSSDQVREILDTVANNAPNEMKFYMIYKKYSPDTKLEEAIDDINSKMDTFKKSLEKDANGRLIGNGNIVELTDV